MIVGIEGIDGSGKDTQLDRLIEYRKNENPNKYKIIEKIESISKDPLGIQIREELSKSRNIPNLIIASAFSNEINLISDSIKEKKSKAVYEPEFYLNRWIYSTMAYNSKTDDDIEFIHSFFKTTIRPDMIIYLDIDPYIALDRILKRQKDREAYENADTLKRVRDNYAKIFHNNHILYSTELNIIDANRSEEEVFKDVYKCIFKYIGLRS